MVVEHLADRDESWYIHRFTLLMCHLSHRSQWVTLWIPRLLWRHLLMAHMRLLHLQALVPSTMVAGQACKLFFFRFYMAGAGVNCKRMVSIIIDVAGIQLSFFHSGFEI